MENNDFTEFYQTLSGQKTEYFREHGITEPTLSMIDWEPGYCKDWEHPDRPSRKGDKIIFPVTKYAYRAVDPNPWKNDYGQNIGDPSSSFICFGDLLDQSAPCYFITHHEMDALSLLEIGYPAIAYGMKKDCTTRLMNLLFQREAAGRNDKDKIFILATNERDKGEADQIAVNLAREGYKISFVNLLLESDRYTDSINEMLRKDRAAFKKIADRHAADIIAQYDATPEMYAKGSALEKAKGLFERIQAGNHDPIATDFDRLNEALDGGLFAGLYVLGAISSLGKTTFMLQLADGIAKNGGSVLFFSLEMATDELIAKSYSRLSYELAENKRNAKTVRGILNPLQVMRYNPEEKKLLFETVPAEYAKYADQLYINEGLGSIGVPEIREAIQKHIDATGYKPTVFIDYLQILKSPDIHISDKQAVDINVLELKKLSREFNIPIFAVSSFNRDSYYEPVSLKAFKESGAIEYSSDVLIGLQPAGVGKEDKGKKPIDTVEECKATELRDIELKILKNRNGQTNVTIPFTYWTKFNHYKEIPEDKDIWE